jgi:uncharacterized protein (DUF2267 family)
MPMPTEYQLAAQGFERFLRDAIEASGLATRNQVYTMVQGVFQVFRRRLDVRDAVRFADILPPILRAIFVSNWDTDVPKRSFESRNLMTEEARSLRRDHNFSPSTAIKDVATALRKNVNETELGRVLSTLPKEASEFWRI